MRLIRTPLYALTHTHTHMLGLNRYHTCEQPLFAVYLENLPFIRICVIRPRRLRSCARFSFGAGLFIHSSFGAAVSSFPVSDNFRPTPTIFAPFICFDVLRHPHYKVGFGRKVRKPIHQWNRKLLAFSMLLFNDDAQSYQMDKEIESDRAHFFSCFVGSALD